MSFPSNFKFCTSMGTYDFDDVFVRREIFSQGGGWLWGCGSSGQLGNNSTINQSSPVQTVSGGSNWKQLGTGFGLAVHSGAIKTDGTLWMWGDNNSGQLGNNDTIDQSSPVQTISNVTTWKQASIGQGYSSAIKTDGTLWMWGTNSAGRLGNNSTTSQSSPVQTVSNVTTWKQVSTSTNHSGAIKTDGTLWLWGCGSSGQLGNNSTINRSSPVQAVTTGTNWKQVSLGSFHSAAIKTDGTLWLWGSNGCGRLGNNNTINVSSPVQTVTSGTNWKQVSAGCNHLAAIKTDGTLWLWGDNNFGELGNNSTINQSSPVQTISGGSNWKQVDISNDFSAAIKTDGTLWLWGEGACGKLGNNSTINRSSPVQTVTTGTNWVQVSLSQNHSATIREDCY